MSVEQAILEAVRALPIIKQQEILSHATRLREEEIEANQREMWNRFPAEDI